MDALEPGHSISAGVVGVVVGAGGPAAAFVLTPFRFVEGEVLEFVPEVLAGGADIQSGEAVLFDGDA